MTSLAASRPATSFAASCPVTSFADCRPIAGFAGGDPRDRLRLRLAPGEQVGDRQLGRRPVLPTAFVVVRHRWTPFPGESNALLTGTMDTES
ncbi:hypothetical protein [Saccharothrix stipae]